MVPVINTVELHFFCIGVHNGIAVLQDRETGSYWNHITGECIHGPLKGKKMESLLLGQMTAEQALKRWPDLELALSKQTPFQKWVLQPVMNLFGRFGIYPPGFRKTMVKRDNRLPDMTSGVGIITDEVKRFYPIDTIVAAGGEVRDQLEGRPVIVSVDEDGFPDVAYGDTDDWEDVPQYLYTRWYGFALTFWGCDIFEPKAKKQVSAS
ncbi:MAG: DUF3179 domain-containing (seleno)protein [Firmicutes bacterium]|uniref:DUF3179 domain-containing protein n=2 Tax=Melghirimyces thermohalophilus TaxID=1236220 RepID=A0A1G6QMN9_9BACL|nr:DUF3179 domain-containing (seleno)protein [Melghirimyces thermohalophilus]MDA8353973.1 DUF3179 domain-containing (seleno)protein [Bacillota bacterium]SDC92996.1 Protein of unknown function [Melghirimyces thermohalophilus]